MSSIWCTLYNGSGDSSIVIELIVCNSYDFSDCLSQAVTRRWRDQGSRIGQSDLHCTRIDNTMLRNNLHDVADGCLCLGPLGPNSGQRTILRNWTPANEIIWENLPEI